MSNGVSMNTLSMTALDRALYAINTATLLIAESRDSSEAINLAAAMVEAARIAVAQGVEQAGVSAGSAAASAAASASFKKLSVVKAAAAALSAQAAAASATVANADAQTVSASLTAVLLAVSSLVDGADSAHNTLGKLATLIASLGVADIAGLPLALSSKASEIELSSHALDTTNPHAVSAAQVGLDKVANLAPLSYPVSTAQAQAVAAAMAGLVGGADASHNTLGKLAALIAALGVADIAGLSVALAAKATPADISAAIAKLTAGSPAELDTFVEAYNRFLTDETAAAVLNASVATLQSAYSTHASNLLNPHGVTKAQVGLGSADNTPDANKPVSAAQALALARKQDISVSVDGSVVTATVSEIAAEFAAGLFYIGGTGDDHSRLQSILDKRAGKTCELASSYFLKSGTLLRDGTELIGRKGLALQTATGFAPTDVLLATDSSSSSVYQLSNVRVKDIIFDGNNMKRSQPLLSLRGIDNLVTEDVIVQNTRNAGTVVTGCRNWTLVRPVWINCGKDIADAIAESEGGPALYTGVYRGLKGKNGRIVDAIAHDNRWSVAYHVGDEDVRWTEPRLNDNGESAIYNHGVDVFEMKGGHIKGQRAVVVAGHGVECENAGRFSVLGVTLDDLDGCCVGATNGSDVTVDLCDLGTHRKNTALFPAHGAVHVSYYQYDGQPDDPTRRNRLRVTRNRYAPGGTPFAALTLVTYNTTPKAFTETQFTDNEGVASTTWAAATYGSGVYGEGVWMQDAVAWGARSRRMGNIGCRDDLPYFRGEVALPAGAGSTVVSGIPFRPRAIEFVTSYTNTSEPQLSLGYSDDFTSDRSFALNTSASAFDGTASTIVKPNISGNHLQFLVSSRQFGGFTLNVISNDQPGTRVLYKAYP